MRPTDFCNRQTRHEHSLDRSILESPRTGAFAPIRGFHAPLTEVSRVEPRLTTRFQLRHRLRWPSIARGSKLRTDLWGLDRRPSARCSPIAAFSAVDRCRDTASGALSRARPSGEMNPASDARQGHCCRRLVKGQRHHRPRVPSIDRVRLSTGPLSQATPGAARRLLQPLRSASTTTNRLNPDRGNRCCASYVPRNRPRLSPRPPTWCRKQRSTGSSDRVAQPHPKAPG